ncbi:hypothetical protein TNCV_3520401 [Trichonephila clavipes]|nr:hypothetical protein TNCV_3520401 [Trichonephila clavipes]
MGILIISISGYNTSAKNMDLNSLVQHNDSSDENSRTTAMVSFCDVTGMKLRSGLSPNQLTLRIASGTETTRIRKENTTYINDVLPMINF